jgi:hypothetical protein
MLCRSQTVLGIQFADLFSLVLEDQGISDWIALVATITLEKPTSMARLNMARQ